MTSELVQIIEQWLEKEDRSRANLARRAGIAEAVLTRIVHGQQKAGPRVRRKLERAMGLAPGTLEETQAQAHLFNNGEKEAENGKRS